MENNEEMVYMPAVAEVFVDNVVAADAPQQEQQSESVSEEQSPSSDISLEMLDAYGETKYTTPELAEAEAEISFEIPDTDEGRQLAELFEKVYGYKFEQLNEYKAEYKKLQEEVKQYQEVQQQLFYQQSVMELSKTWRIPVEDVESRLELIKERFRKYPKEIQDKFDNIEGAKLIWAKIEQERGKIPQFNRSRVGDSMPQPSVPTFTKKQIMAMSDVEYAANAAKIAEAFRLGLVK